MCGIVGFIGLPSENVVVEIVGGLTALQHRGQDAAGVITFQDHFRLKKGLGLVKDVFQPKHLTRLKGDIGIGHVRYTTQGTNDEENAQPFYSNFPFGMAMVHNGNVTNFDELRKTLFNEYHILPDTSNDLELILYTLASELQKRDLKHFAVEDIFEAVRETQKKVKGAYSTITMIANKGLLVFTDPHGIRPLVMGKKLTRQGAIYGFASESTCFDYLGYKTVGDIGPGEAVFIDMNRKVHRQKLYEQKRAFCVFEHIYFARDDSIMCNKLVAEQRVIMGRKIAGQLGEQGLTPDIVIDVPSSGYFAASGLAEALNIPYRRGLVKNNFIGRSFIMPNQADRERMVHQKLNPISAVVSDKNVAVVDDSVVRGTTSKRIVDLLKKAGAKEVYFISAAPAIKHPCIYGIDMAVTTELIAANNSEEEIASYIGADAVIYQSIPDLKEIYADLPICTACFEGKYPVKGSKQALKRIEEERLIAKRRS